MPLHKRLLQKGHLVFSSSSQRSDGALYAVEADIQRAFEMADTSTQLLQLIGADNKLLVLDEAQKVPDIGRKLKLIYDTRPDIQIIATGSSSFDLQDKTAEPLTGRKRTFYLYPLSYREIAQGRSVLEAGRLLDTRLIYGLYPDVVNNPGNEKTTLMEIAGSYLYKDILKPDYIHKPAYTY